MSIRVIYIEHVQIETFNFALTFIINKLPAAQNDTTNALKISFNNILTVWVIHPTNEVYIHQIFTQLFSSFLFELSSWDI